jgi:hypothetical protein
MVTRHEFIATSIDTIYKTFHTLKKKKKRIEKVLTHANSSH